MKNSFLSILILSMILLSCNLGREKVRGNGDIRTEVRNESGFQSVEVQGSIKVYVRQDSLFSVKVEADENLLKHVETYLQKNTLIIKPENGIRLKPTRSVKVYISGPSFRYFNVSGASEINSEGRISSPDEFFLDISGASTAKLEIKSPKTGLDLSGACTASVSGETRDLEIDASGASNAYCYALQSENAVVDLAGASKAEVFASLKLDASASGASNIHYKGNPTVKQSTSGASGVKKE